MSAQRARKKKAAGSESIKKSACSRCGCDLSGRTRVYQEIQRFGLLKRSDWMRFFDARRWRGGLMRMYIWGLDGVWFLCGCIVNSIEVV